MPGTTHCPPHIRRFDVGDEPELLRVFFSAVRDIASLAYTAEQIEAWAPRNLDQAAWAQHMRVLKPFVAEIDHQIVGYAEAARLHLPELTADVSRSAQPFFVHHGFVIVAQQAPIRRGVAIPNARMRKVLGDRGHYRAGV